LIVPLVEPVPSVAGGFAKRAIVAFGSCPGTNQKAESLAEKFEQVANLLVERIPGFIDNEKTTLSMVATAAGIAVDKARLLRDQPTSISSTSELTDDRRARIAAIFDRARARRAG